MHHDEVAKKCIVWPMRRMRPTRLAQVIVGMTP